MKKIFQYFSGFFTASGGIEIHLRDIVQSLDYEFEIITDALSGYPAIEKLSPLITIRRFYPKNREITPLPYLWVNRLIFPYRIFGDVLRSMTKLDYLKNTDYDLLHVHGLNLGEALLKLSLILGSDKIAKRTIDFSAIDKPKLLTIHGLELPGIPIPSIIKNLTNFLIDQFGNIICVDMHIQNYIVSNWKNKNVWHIPNWVDTKKFEYTKPKEDKKLKVGFVGRLEYSRGLPLLYQLIKKCPPSIQLHIVGAYNPGDVKRFKSNVDISKIDLQVGLNYEDMPKFYESIDILFNPVTFEGVSRATLEAMACGRPVIMIDRGDRYPVVHGKTGYLIQEDVSDLLKLLQHIQADREEIKKLGKNAREVVEKEFDSKIIIPKIKEIYETVAD